MNSSDLKYFVQVAESKNISRAADILGLAQPSLSAALKKLEATLDVQLLIRSRKGVHMTKAGEILYAKGRQLLVDMDQLQLDMHKSEREVCGRFRLGCHSAVALYALPLFCPQLLQEYPQLEIRLTHDLSRRVTDAVIRFDLDFGIVVNPVRHPDLVIQKLGTDQVGFWTGPKKTSTNSMSESHRVLICDRNLLQVEKLLQILEKRKITFRRIIPSSSLEVVASLVASGAGVGILPGRVAAHFGPLGLRPLPEAMPTFKDQIAVVFRGDSPRSVATRLIQQKIRSAFL